jgi:hypothetical protein
MIACKKYMNFTTYYNKTINDTVKDFMNLLTSGLCLELNTHNISSDIVLYITYNGDLCVGDQKGSPTSSLFFSKIYCVLVENTRKVNLFNKTSNSVWYTIILPTCKSARRFEKYYNTCVEDYEKYSTTNKIKTNYIKLE